MTGALEVWNGLDAAEAAAEVLPCCGSWAWARGMAERRPLRGWAEVLEASDAVWWGLTEVDWSEAFGSHPRIGEGHAPGAATPRSLEWSGREQSGVALDEDDVGERLAEGNRAYEERFGRTFLVCASGKSGGEILSILKRRLGNDAEAEMREAAEQQRQISRLRLEQWMGAE